MSMPLEFDTPKCVPRKAHQFILKLLTRSGLYLWLASRLSDQHGVTVWQENSQMSQEAPAGC